MANFTHSPFTKKISVAKIIEKSLDKLKLCSALCSNFLRFFLPFFPIFYAEVAQCKAQHFAVISFFCVHFTIATKIVMCYLKRLFVVVECEAKRHGTFS